MFQAFYGVGLNNSTILEAIGYGSDTTDVYHYYNNLATGNIILVCAGAIPGYWVTVALCDTIGRKPIQLGGFIILTILFCIMGFGYHVIGTGGLFACYVLAQFFFNFG
jgi:MFS transporter, PHS family, inorganic phosphate transporter